MKKFIKLLLPLTTVFNSTLSIAASIYFQGPCRQQPFLKMNVPSKHVIQKASIGHITIDILEKKNIEFLGSIKGLASVDNTPIGHEAIEVISPNYLRAYGWCYEVNGFQPAKMPDQIIIKKNDVIRWFFAFSSFKDGEWIDYCTPSYQIKSSFLCN